MCRVNNKIISDKKGILVKIAVCALEAQRAVRAGLHTEGCLLLAQTLQAQQTALVQVGDTVVQLLPEEAQVRMRAREGMSVADADGIVVGIDTELTPALEREGLARDIVRRVQDARKNAGLEIEDRITLTYRADESLRPVFDDMGEYIAAETLATEVHMGAPIEGGHTESFSVGDGEVVISVRRAD